MSRQSPLPPRGGIGLKPEHYAPMLAACRGEDGVPPDWVEVHPQNYFGAGGPPHRWLEAVANVRPLSFHSTGLSLGSADGPDRCELDQLAGLVARYQPAMVSDHLSWSQGSGETFPDRGPTGVEMAGAIAELARQSVSKDFRSITPHCSKIVLVQRGDRLLPSFPEHLSERTRIALEQLGVEVILGGRVDAVDALGVTVGNRVIPARTIIWAAGVMASPAAGWLGCEADAAGRVPVGSDLLAPARDHIFVIGDTAACTDAAGRMLPGVAPVAKQQGAYVADAIQRQIAGKPAAPFRYKDRGSMATIGRKRAVVSIGRMHLSGFPAWLVWSAAHVFFLAGFRNRFIVAANWAWSYLTYERSARLITGEIAHESLSTV